MTWRDVKSCSCDWRVQSGVWGWWWWCDVKMVERCCWRMRESACTPSYEMSVWDFMLFWAVVRFPYEISCLLALVPNILFPNSRELGVGSEEVMQRHAYEREFGRKGGLTGWRVNIFWWYHTFLMIFPYNISCFIGRYDMSLWELMLFGAQLSYERYHNGQ